MKTGFTEIDEKIFEEAHAFLEQMASETGKPEHLDERLDEIREELAETGTYIHTLDELEYGAKVAWRNSNRCIGRIFWKSLDVFDHRDLTGPKEMFDALRNYLAHATNGGKIRSSICVFAPKHPQTGREVRILNNKLVRYAGYHREDGVLGDPEEAAFTRTCLALGWSGEGTAFDLLPVVIQVPERSPELFELEPGDALEVEIEHPELPWFKELGLRWYAVPVITNMILEIGGIEYTAAPFNGWFMGTEIGSRNLGDAGRYDMLPEIAEKMNLDTRSKTNLWKDRALVELNTAVLHSYRKAGVVLVDHHTASKQFMSFVEQEKRAGRSVTSEWSWIVPPMSGSAMDVFHNDWPDTIRKPNYFYRSNSNDAGEGRVCPFTGRKSEGERMRE